MDNKFDRRELLALLGFAGAGFAIGCGSSATSPTSPSGSTSGSTNASCAVTPTETIGPYPSHQSLIRSDIREGKSGTPLTLTITVVSSSNNCSPVANANVGIWQCDAAGNYSEYGTQTSQSYLRGIQTTDANGQVTFTTVYPGWYMGRATHIHVEVVRNGSSVKVTQIAFPESINAAVYATGVYAARGGNPTSNASDDVFRDGVSSELASVSGSASAGLTATFAVAIA